MFFNVPFGIDRVFVRLRFGKRRQVKHSKVGPDISILWHERKFSFSLPLNNNRQCFRSCQNNRRCDLYNKKNTNNSHCPSSVVQRVAPEGPNDPVKCTEATSLVALNFCYKKARTRCGTDKESKRLHSVNIRLTFVVLGARV